VTPYEAKFKEAFAAYVRCSARTKALLGKIFARVSPNYPQLFLNESAGKTQAQTWWH